MAGSFFLKKVILSLALPPMLLILVGALGLILWCRRPRLGGALIAFCLTALMMLCFPWVANSLVHGLEKYGPLPMNTVSQAQAIVVLGAGIYTGAPEFGGEDTVKPEGLVRVRFAAYLQRRTALPLLVSGGAPYGGRPEAEAMRELLERDFGVPVRWTEPDSRDTSENARFSSRILLHARIHRVALVTNAWHMPRAKLEFERMGLVVFPAPTGFAVASKGFDLWLPSSGALDQSGNALREWLALLVTRFRP